MCTSHNKDSTSEDEAAADDGDEDNVISNIVSVEDGSEMDADGELSDGKEVGELAFEESDRETVCLSLRSTRGGCRRTKEREYGSEGESRGQRRKRRVWWWPRRLERAWEMKKMDEERMMDAQEENYNNGSGESECVVIAKPKGGGKGLCMDMDEVKACRDLGFDFQREWMLEIPNWVSAPGSTVDTDSGGNSPIASWRISSPGDDPKDVKARLKVWAQAVALASTSCRNG